jgi:transcriptional regulator with XRE-family HTH domain
MADALSRRLGQNIRQLRDAQGLTQEQMAKHSGLPRATWANLESGTANPTLAVLTKVAVALRVSMEELIAVPRAACQHYERDSLPTEQRGPVTVRRLLPDPIPGMDLERMEIPPHSQLTGVPHTPGTREYLTCESGALTLFAAGETYQLAPGDVVVFRGDLRHSYRNDGAEPAIGYSVVLFVPAF